MIASVKKDNVSAISLRLADNTAKVSRRKNSNEDQHRTAKVTAPQHTSGIPNDKNKMKLRIMTICSELLMDNLRDSGLMNDNDGEEPGSASPGQESPCGGDRVRMGRSFSHTRRPEAKVLFFHFHDGFFCKYDSFRNNRVGWMLSPDSQLSIWAIHSD